MRWLLFITFQVLLTWAYMTLLYNFTLGPTSTFHWVFFTLQWSNLSSRTSSSIRKVFSRLLLCWCLLLYPPMEEVTWHQCLGPWPGPQPQVDINLSENGSRCYPQHQHSLHPEQVSSQDLGGQDTRGGIHWCEARGESFLHLWLSNLYSYIYREEDQVGAFQQVGFIRGLQWDFKGL